MNLFQIKLNPVIIKVQDEVKEEIDIQKTESEST